MAVLLTLISPIRSPSKTAAALENKIQRLLERGRVEVRMTRFTGIVSRLNL